MTEEKKINKRGKKGKYYHKNTTIINIYFLASLTEGFYFQFVEGEVVPLYSGSDGKCMVLFVLIRDCGILKNNSSEDQSDLGGENFVINSEI